MARKQRMRVRDKKVQKMTRNGLIEENLTEKSTARISKRDGDVKLERKSHLGADERMGSSRSTQQSRDAPIRGRRNKDKRLRTSDSDVGARDAEELFDAESQIDSDRNEVQTDGDDGLKPGQSKSLMHRKDVDEVICATDAGREGELIFRLVYEEAGCKKPVKRLWISSMEESSIREGFANLKDGSCYDDLYRSALCRAQADWLVGINASRLFSVLYDKTLRVGRVQTPTLAMIVDRNEKVKGFQKEKYYQTQLTFGEMKAVSEKMTGKEAAEELAAECKGKNCQVVTNEATTKTVKPPSLYDLTTLQRDANRILGYTAQQTLDAAQELYEAGLITYPRTDSQYLNNEMEATEEELIALLETLMDFMDLEDYEPEVKKTLDSSKVSDHHAIIPTEKLTADRINGLSIRCRNVLILIESRVLMATSKPYVYETHNCDIVCGAKHFQLSFRNVKQPGFKTVEKGMYLYFGKTLPEEVEELPDLTVSQEYGPCDAQVLEKWTQPPKQFTEDTLLAAMERAGNADITDETEKKGMGTPATRAAIIEKLVSSGFIAREKKNLVPTGDGSKLITILPEEIKSPKMTADWEMKLNQIASGEADADEFIKGITSMMEELTKRYAGVSEEKREQFASEKESLGKCPRCGSPVYEGQKNYYCSSHSCQFALWKNDKFFASQGKKMDTATVKKLLSKGKIHYRDLHSQKTGKRYEASIVLADPGEGYVKFNLEFPQR